ncbi:hypothetical protein NX794_04130 [Streptomyces sp. LP11]|uniref:Uncharacterized protein n=1 Tax=Streptomyces pyxinicus TaxID=2970331 RepID=A0ABT2AVZ4_9ACTN|nr:hypothetical protein [Streptomyces sp. LP11]MCS0600422.1 hypothetical protein [Streptomyces sp. LP11]
MSLGRWAVGVGALVVLAATGAWAKWPADTGAGRQVDARLWSGIRPVLEAGLEAGNRGSGYGGTHPGLGARWFCRAEPLALREHGTEVWADVDTLCVEYGVRGGALVGCGGEQVPQVVRLARKADGGYRLPAREEAPDGAGNASRTQAHFGRAAGYAVEEPMDSAGLERAARTHFGLPADAPVRDC